MKRLALVAIAVVSLAAYAVADQINFNFTLGGSNSVVATAAGGLTAGPSTLTSISDSTTGVNIPFPGTFVTAITGPASSFVNLGTLILATFTGATGTTVLVEDSLSNVLVAGSMQDNASLLSTIPVGTGSFLGTFDVSFVSPAALALFGLGPAFQPVGSVAFTFANANFDGTTLTANIGGGSVTIETLQRNNKEASRGRPTLRAGHAQAQPAARNYARHVISTIAKACCKTPILQIRSVESVISWRKVGP